MQVGEVFERDGKKYVVTAVMGTSIAYGPYEPLPFEPVDEPEAVEEEAVEAPSDIEAPAEEIVAEEPKKRRTRRTKA